MALVRKSLLFTVIASTLACSAVAAAQEQTMGAVTVTYNHFTYSGKILTADGGVKLTSDTFKLSSRTVVIYMGGGKGMLYGITKATADGQVVGNFVDPTTNQTFTFLADHAVYTPDTSRPKGGTVDFTGHVTMQVVAPGSLRGPSMTNLQHCVITLGAGPDYPTIDGDQGQTVLTPLH